VSAVSARHSGPVLKASRAADCFQGLVLCEIDALKTKAQSYSMAWHDPDVNDMTVWRAVI